MDAAPESLLGWPTQPPEQLPPLAASPIVASGDAPSMPASAPGPVDASAPSVLLEELDVLVLVLAFDDVELAVRVELAEDVDRAELVDVLPRVELAALEATVALAVEVDDPPELPLRLVVAVVGVLDGSPALKSSPFWSSPHPPTAAHATQPASSP